VAAFATAAGGYVLGVGAADIPARVAAVVSGACLLWVAPVSTAIGAALLVATVGWVWLAQRRAAPPPLAQPRAG